MSTTVLACRNFDMGWLVPYFFRLQGKWHQGDFEQCGQGESLSSP